MYKSIKDFAAFVILFQVAFLADTPCIARIVFVLAVSAELTSAHAVVALVTLPFCVEGLVSMRTIGYLPFTYR